MRSALPSNTCPEATLSKSASRRHRNDVLQRASRFRARPHHAHLGRRPSDAIHEHPLQPRDEQDSALDERAAPKLTDDERADIDDEIDFIFHRAGLLRRGEFCVVLSAVVSGLLVALCVLEEATGFSADILNSALLLASVALIVLSTVFLSLEIRLSLRAIKLVVSKLPPVADAFDDAVAARAAQAVEARHQSHVLNEARRQAEHAASHEVRKAEGGHSA